MIFSNIKDILIKNYMKRRTIIQKFKHLGAFNMDLAIKLDDFKKEDFSIIKNMRSSGVIVKVGYNDLYYFDEKKLLENRLKKTKWAMILLLAIIIFLFRGKF
jgi:hypothetical protein